VSFTPKSRKEKRFLQLQNTRSASSEREGHSVFYKDESGAVFIVTRATTGKHKLNIHYHYLDLAPKGRMRRRDPSGAAHDEYGG